MFCTESSHRVVYEYNKDNNVSSITETVNGTTKTYSYTYDDDKRLISENADGITVIYTYDDLGRLTQKQTLNGDTVIKTDSYTFTASTIGTNGTSSQVASYNGLSYTYDDNGNILSVSDGTNTTSYVYDSANQLVRENNQALGFTKVWTYDNAGNILSRSEYAYTTADDLSSLTATDAVTYQYTSAKWGDMLRYYGDSYLRYDASGNVTNDGKFTYTWAHGRQLASITTPSGAQIQMTYGADGLRTGRVVKTSSGAVKAAYTYVYDGGKLSRMTYGNYVVDITYDAAGTPLTMIVNGQTTYYYVTNLQGDVIALKDAAGTEVITYSYDAWGNVVSRTGTYATLNPLLYRGYVYDWETHHYYLQSRYYNPEWGRFINGDALATTGQGFIGNNMFAYCLNNPVNYSDPSGNMPAALKRYLLFVVVTACIFGLYDTTEANYKHNSAKDNDESSTTRNKIINDQHGATGDGFIYGLYFARDNACETIAVHNAKVLLGKESTLSETMRDFQNAGAMIGNGYFGSNPLAIGDVLKNSGISYSNVGLSNMTKEGVYIISYWNEDPLNNGLHTIAVSYDGAAYIAYNLRCDGHTYAINPMDYTSSFICGYYLEG